MVSVEKFYGQFNPPVDQFIYERYFFDKKIKGVFIECGAGDGEIENSCKFFEESMGWSGFNIEAAPPNYANLVKNRPNSRNLQIGLSSSDGKTQFLHAISPVLGENFGNGSIHHTPEHLQALKEDGCDFKEYEIEILTWRTLVQREGITHVDLFVLDVEGHELSVLEGMRGCLVLPSIICIEVGHLSLSGLRTALQELGYVYDISSHANAFFVRSDLLSLFCLRSVAAWSEKTRIERNESKALHENASKAHDELMLRHQDLERTYTGMVQSRGWRFVESLRGIKSFVFRR